VDDETGGLVEDEQVRVLVHHGERDRLGPGLRGLRRGDVDLDALAAAKRGRGARVPAVDTHLSGGDQRLDPGAAQAGQPRGEPAVEALARGAGIRQQRVALAFAACGNRRDPQLGCGAASTGRPLGLPGPRRRFFSR
jgi:hypothetical protein